MQSPDCCLSVQIQALQFCPGAPASKQPDVPLSRSFLATPRLQWHFWAALQVILIPDCNASQPLHSLQRESQRQPGTLQGGSGTTHRDLEPIFFNATGTPEDSCMDAGRGDAGMLFFVAGKVPLANSTHGQSPKTLDSAKPAL